MKSIKDFTKKLEWLEFWVSWYEIKTDEDEKHATIKASLLTSDFMEHFIKYVNQFDVNYYIVASDFFVEIRIGLNDIETFV